MAKPYSDAERIRVHGALQPIGQQSSYPVFTIAMLVAACGTLGAIFL